MTIEYRWADGQLRTTAGAGDRSGRPSTRSRDRHRQRHSAALAAKAATATVPIVFVAGRAIPSRSGFVASLSAAGRQPHRHNNIERGDSAAKRLEAAASELLPATTRRGRARQPGSTDSAHDRGRPETGTFGCRKPSGCRRSTCSRRAPKRDFDIAFSTLASSGGRAGL